MAYFSESGNTKDLAVRLAGAISADIYRIEPETEYTDADLDWNDEGSRSSKERDDGNSRPEIKGHVENFAKYDKVFVGFPVWWYREPRIIDTFLESEDFSGKKVIPFATSGSSPIGDSGKNMQEIVPEAEVLEGSRFAADTSAEDLKKWADQF